MELWVNNYRNRSDTIESLLNVSLGRVRREEIAGEVIAWLISVSCAQPKDLGYVAETWTVRSLAKHIHEKAKEAGFERLATISTSRLYEILDSNKISTVNDLQPVQKNSWMRLPRAYV